MMPIVLVVLVRRLGTDECILMGSHRAAGCGSLDLYLQYEEEQLCCSRHNFQHMACAGHGALRRENEQLIEYYWLLQM